MGTQPPAPKGAELHPIFGPRLLWPNGCMDQDATWYRAKPRPTRHCTRRGPSSRERGIAAPLFSAHVYCGHGRPSKLLLSSCSKFFTDRLSDKFTVKSLLKIPPNFKCIATLPSDLYSFQTVASFLTLILHKVM